MDNFSHYLPLLLTCSHETVQKDSILSIAFNYTTSLWNIGEIYGSLVPNKKQALKRRLFMKKLGRARVVNKKRRHPNVGVSPLNHKSPLQVSELT